MASQVSSSSRSRDSRASSPRPKPPCAPASRWRSRTSREAVVSGFSTGRRSAAARRRAGRRRRGRRTSSRGGAMTSVRRVGAGGSTGLRRRPLVSSPAVRPIATTAMPMIRYSHSPMRPSNQPRRTAGRESARLGAGSGAVLARALVGARAEAGLARPGGLGAHRRLGWPGGPRRRAVRRRRARARRSAATGPRAASAGRATARRGGPRRGAGRRRTPPPRRRPARSPPSTPRSGSCRPPCLRAQPMQITPTRPRAAAG